MHDLPTYTIRKNNYWPSLCAHTQAAWLDLCGTTTVVLLRPVILLLSPHLKTAVEYLSYAS